MLYYIYKISVGDRIYIGSTKDFERRIRQHKYCILHPESLNGQSLYHNECRKIGFEKCVFEIIKQIDVTSKIEARLEEQATMNLFDDHLLLNVKNAYTTKEQDRNYRNEQKRLKWIEIKNDPIKLKQLHIEHNIRGKIFRDKIKNNPVLKELRNEKQRIYRANKKLI